MDPWGRPPPGGTGGHRGCRAGCGVRAALRWRGALVTRRDAARGEASSVRDTAPRDRLNRRGSGAPGPPRSRGRDAQKGQGCLAGGPRDRVLGRPGRMHPPGGGYRQPRVRDAERGAALLPVRCRGHSGRGCHPLTSATSLSPAPLGRDSLERPGSRTPPHPMDSPRPRSQAFWGDPWSCSLSRLGASLAAPPLWG